MSDQAQPPVPLQSMLVGKNGLLTQPWANWFTLLFLRTGGSNSLSITALQSAVTTLQVDVASNTNDITALESGFNNLTVGHDL